MPSPFEFQLNLMGNFAAKLAPVNAGLDDTSTKGSKAAKSVGELERQFAAAAARAKAFSDWQAKGFKIAGLKTDMGGLSSSIAGVGLNLDAAKNGGSLFTFDLAKGLGEVIDLAKAAASAIYDIGASIVQTAAKRQDLDVALNLTAGADGAADIGDLAKGFSNTRFSASTVKQALLPLMDAGLTDKKQLGLLASAAADVSARQNTGAEGFAGALGAFENIFKKERLNPKMLAALSIKPEAFFKDLADLVHTTADVAEKRAKLGMYKSETLMSVALNQIGAREGTPGAVGKGALVAGKTLGATLERLSNLWPSLLGKLANTPGLSRLQQVLDKFVDTMTGPAGDKLMGAIGQIVDQVGEMLFGLADGNSGFGKLVNSINQAVAGVEIFGQVLKGSMAATGALAGAITTPFEGLYLFLEKIIEKAMMVPRALGAARDFFDDIGKFGTAGATAIFNKKVGIGGQGQDLGWVGGGATPTIAPRTPSVSTWVSPELQQARAEVGAGPKMSTWVSPELQQARSSKSLTVGELHVHVESAGSDPEAHGQAVGVAVRPAIKKMLDELGDA